MMDNKLSELSELSKPVQIFKHPHGQAFWCVVSDNVGGTKDVHAYYSQEYVSALLADNEYLRMRIKEHGSAIRGMLLTMQAAVIEVEHGKGPNIAMEWIVNKLMGPGEFAPDSEKDAQAYFNRESEKIDAEYNKVMEFYKRRSEAEKEQRNG
jgi:hypothetical protein